MLTILALVVTAGIGDYFTDELCAGVIQKLGERKGRRVINAAMAKARAEHRRRVTKVML